MPWDSTWQFQNNDTVAGNCRTTEAQAQEARAAGREET